MSSRRELIIAFGVGALVTPLGAFAQQKEKVWRVGFLASRHVDFVDSDYYYGPFRQGMREQGYVEGKNLVIEWRSAGGKNERLPELAAELVRLKVDIIVTPGSLASLAAQKITNTIPIVIIGTGDPVGIGLIKSLARPGGNITGLSNMTTDLTPKLLELLLTAAPKVSRVAILMNPINTTHTMQLKRVQASAPRINVKIIPAEARNPLEIENAFSTMARENAEAIMVLQDPFYRQQIKLISDLVSKHRLPSIATYAEFVEAGVLISYGENRTNLYRSTATYVDKILKGAKPADLPVEQPTIFELFINGKTAKALGLKIPQSLLIMANKVIE